jgi:hypothetical protein
VWRKVLIVGEARANSRLYERAAAIQNKKIIANIERNAFNPVSLNAIGKEEEEESTLFETSKGEYERIDLLIETAKRAIPIDTFKLEVYGDFAFDTGQLKSAIDAYESAATWGSKTAPNKLYEVAHYIFSKKDHVCDHKHISTGWCHLRGKSIQALQSVGSKEELFKIGELTESRDMHHCAILSYKAAVEKGSLEARRKLIDLGKKLEHEDPYLAKVASKCAKIINILQ